MKVTYVRSQRKSVSNIRNDMHKDHQVKDGLTHPRILPCVPSFESDGESKIRCSQCDGQSQDYKHLILQAK